jgi:hypothetical protein
MTDGALDRHAAFLHTDSMSKITLVLSLISVWVLSGCSSIQNVLPGPAPIEVVASPTSADYVAPTLPPVSTETPTATTEPTAEPSPTPFTVVSVETETPEATTSVGVPTPAFAFTKWERFEASRFNLSINLPDALQATVLGQNIVIESPSSAEVPIQLSLELRVDSANSFRLPDGINPADPRSVLEGVLDEIEAGYDTLSMIRPVTNVNVQGKPAAEAAARTGLGAGDTAEETVWYLAVVVNQETIVRVYASAPADSGVAYLAVAERITDSLEFLSEP